MPLAIASERGTRSTMFVRCSLAVALWAMKFGMRMMSIFASNTSAGDVRRGAVGLLDRIHGRLQHAIAPPALSSARCSSSSGWLFAVEDHQRATGGHVA